MDLNSWRLPLTHGIELILQTYLTCEDCVPGDFRETACCLRCTPRMCKGQRPPLLYSFDCDFDKVTCNLLQRNHCLYLEIHKLSDHCPPESVMTYCEKLPCFLFCYSQGAFLPVTLATEQLTEQANHRSKVRATSLSHPQPGSCTKLKSAFSR